MNWTRYNRPFLDTAYSVFFLKFLIVTEAYGGHSIEVGREVVCVAGGIFVFVFFSLLLFAK